MNSSKLDEIPEVIHEATQINSKEEIKNSKSFYYSSKKYSATGGTGGEGALYSGVNSYHNRKTRSPTKVLGDYHMVIINKAFVDF